MPVDHDRRASLPPSRLSRRTALRFDSAAPIVAMEAIAGRAGGFGAPLAATLQEVATPATAAVARASSPAAGAPASPAVSPTAAVTVNETTQLRFDPDHVTPKVGETITWVKDKPLPHTATGDPAQNPEAESHQEAVRLPDGAEPWGSELLQPAESYFHTFVTPGEYQYICVPHVLSRMRAAITMEC